MTAPVEFRHVCATGWGGRGLRELDLRCEAGEWVTLFGPAASGKTLALRLAAGEVRPVSGTVDVLGAPAVPRRRGVALVSASASRVGRMTVRGRLLWSLAHAGTPAFQRAARASELLDALGLSARAEAPEADLSGCERTALAVASALAAHPRVVLIDDIIGSATPDLRDRVVGYLDARRAMDGWCVLHATVSAAMAARADRVVMLDQGEVLAVESPRALIDRLVSTRVVIEASDPSEVRRTLTGLFDTVVEETGTALTIQAAHGISTAAHLFRHPAGGVRVVHVLRGDLWDAHRKLRASRHESAGPQAGCAP